MPSATVFHVHFLSDYWLKEVLPGLGQEFDENIDVANGVFRYLATRPNRRQKIITLVRDPIARDVSDVFQNWQAFFPGMSLSEVRTEDVVAFLDRQPHDFGETWFDTEFRAFTGIDVFALPFAPEKGFAVYRLQQFDVLVLKLESLDKCYRSALKAICGVTIPELVQSNFRRDEIGGALYDTVRRVYRVKRDKCDRVYGSRYVKHFFTSAEISSFHQ